MANTLLGSVASAPCAGCGTARGPLCRRCRESVGRPLADGSVAAVDRVVAAWEYDGPARELVLALKLRDLGPAAGPLADAMAAAALRCGLLGGVLTWVPARPRDVRRRGYDHARVLAEEVGRRLGLPARALLRRIGDPPDQTALGAAARRRNLRGAFVARPCSGPIVLVDDLVTTGATATACARALRASGATAVEVLAACRKS
jgi:competence protein ComFC